MKSFSAYSSCDIFHSILSLATLLLLLPAGLAGQSTVGTSNINGTVTDPSGAAVGGASVIIVNLGTGAIKNLTTNASGFYNSGTIIPAGYRVLVQAKGFQSAQFTALAELGNNSIVNVTLQVGSETQTVTVNVKAVAVNTEQSSIQGVLNSTQIQQLPINGRNFLDLAQLEPGVQIQDGTDFDPTKIGYQSVSIGGRYGRTARIQLDGVDISDETVGTTTGNIGSNAIQEFQIAQSTMDLSNDLSSSGVVNVTTKSGTNVLHGETFEYYRSSAVDASLPHPDGLSAPYHRNQFGADAGGAFIENKLFFFAEGDRTKQDLFVPVEYAQPFTSFSGGFNSAYGNTNALGRMDFNAPHGVKLFYRYAYSQINAEGTFFSDSLQVYASNNYFRNSVAGADFMTGTFNHSFRFSYLKFQNGITDAVIGSSLPLANFPGDGLYLTITVRQGPKTGPNVLAPQGTPQSDKQTKYDGAKTWGKHILRYGVDYNHIHGGGYSTPFGFAPQVVTNVNSGDRAFAAAGPYSGGASNPLNYPVDLVFIGNGQGFSTTQPAFGFPAGGLGPDNRIGLYISDTWKVLPNLSVNIGVRYDRDTGRTDSDLPGLSFLNNLIADFPNLGAPIPNPNLNFAPTLGVAWDPWNNGQTAIRAGIGLYYENAIFNNVLFDRPLRLPTGAFAQGPQVCSNGQALAIPGIDLPVTAAECGTAATPIRIGDAGRAISTLQQNYQALSPFSLTNANPNYLQNFVGAVNFPNGLFAPNYKTPRSTQMNVGIQRELRPGIVVSVDYVRNVTTALSLDVDLNHTGSTKYFYKVNAQQAIAKTTSSLGCAGGYSAAAINCAIGAGATISDFAGNGLDSAGDLGGLGGCPPGGCAFGGLNPKQPAMNFLVPAGISRYNALETKLTYQKTNPLKGLRGLNMLVSYTYSSFKNSGGGNVSSPGAVANSDQDFVISALDNDNPNRYFGPSLLDRPQQFSFGVVGNLPWNFQVSFIGHFNSSLALPIIVPGTGAGAIFQTDFTGDGTVEDPLPGTRNGSFERDVAASGLNTSLGAYNAAYGSQPTPAGQVLIANGLMTKQQLQSLGGVAPCVGREGATNCAITYAPPGQQNLGMMRAFDLKLTWAYTLPVKDHAIEFQPTFGVYNLFNFSNFDLPPNVLAGALTASAGSINGTTKADRVANRVGNGTGVFNMGAPRALEFGMSISF
jgi:hypothetical protein